jgi:hypothetical protein
LEISNTLGFQLIIQGGHREVVRVEEFDEKTMILGLRKYFCNIFEVLARRRQCEVHVDKLVTVYITKCNGQRFRLYIREGILCGVGCNLCKR